MQRQVGDLVRGHGIARRRLIVRHPVLPGVVAGGCELMRLIAEEVSRDAYVTIMDPYRVVRPASPEERERNPYLERVRRSVSARSTGRSSSARGGTTCIGSHDDAGVRHGPLRDRIPEGTSRPRLAGGCAHSYTVGETISPCEGYDEERGRKVLAGRDYGMGSDAYPGPVPPDHRSPGRRVLGRRHRAGRTVACRAGGFALGHPRRSRPRRRHGPLVRAAGGGPASSRGSSRAPCCSSSRS